MTLLRITLDPVVCHGQACIRGTAQVIEMARAQQRVLITLDKGFANILLYPSGTHPGIILACPRPAPRPHPGHDHIDIRRIERN